MSDATKFLRAVWARYILLASALKSVALKHEMLQKPDMKAGVPLSFAVQIIWSVMALGFLAEGWPVIEQNPVAGILVGLGATALLVFFVRSLTATAKWLEKILNAWKSWIKFPVDILIEIIYLGLFFASPAAVLWMAARLLPEYVHASAIFSSVLVMQAFVYAFWFEYLLSKFTGVSLYTPPRQ